MAFYETVMVKGYETLVDLDTTVDVNTGMIAAGRLQTLIESRASGTRIADLMVQMGRIIDAVHSTVPEELWPEILRKIDGPVAADTPADEIEDGDDADDEYDAFASYTGTAPIAASSGEVTRHRLSRAGDRQLNCCLHTMAISQISRGHSRDGPTTDESETPARATEKP